VITFTVRSGCLVNLCLVLLAVLLIALNGLATICAVILLHHSYHHI